MNKNTFGFIFVVLLIAFVVAGDSLTFLPPQVRSASVQSRNFVVGLFPKWLKPTDRDAQRKNEIQQIEKGQDPNQQK